MFEGNNLFLVSKDKQSFQMKDLSFGYCITWTLIVVEHCVSYYITYLKPRPENIRWYHSANLCALFCVGMIQILLKAATSTD